MCAHFDPVIQPQRLSTFFGVHDLPLNLKPSLWPGYHGPFVRRHEFAEVGDAAVPLREGLVGSFGLIPHWSKDELIARRTYNARAETVHEKPTYGWYARMFAAELSSAQQRAYDSAETMPRTGQRGLWQDEEPMPPWACRKLRKTGQACR